MRSCLVLIFVPILLATACGGGGSTGPTTPPPTPISISLSATTLTVTQDGTAGSVTVTVTRPAGDTASVTLTAGSIPSGVSAQIDSPGTGNSGTVTFTPQTPGPPASGSYNVTIGATDGTTTASANLTLIVAIVAAVQSSVNTQAGEGGLLQTFMSTAFQPAEWDNQFFTSNPEPATMTALNNLNSRHIRLQPVSQGTPESTQNTWNFSTLDAILTPVISVADNSPELQLAVGPTWMDDATTGYLESSHYQDFANYAADVVEYYNTSAGFGDATGATHVHSATDVTPVTWWGIFNEPNINGLSAAQYVSLYNTVVPAMQAAQSTVPIKFVAVELSDFGDQPESYLPTFAQGVTAHVDVVATHFYSSCDQSDLDATVFNTVPGFASDVKYIYTQLQTNAALANVPVWVTENNVNADFANSSGGSTCNPGQKFVSDQRGTDAFFAAWRPYVFSRLAQAGARALYHWDFDADQQFGEVNFTGAAIYLSYWVDYWLERYYPACDFGVASCAGAPQSILNLSSTDASSVETLATENPDRSVVVMIANRAVQNPAADDNGAGAPRTILIDVSALGSFTSATQLTIDATTSVAQGPSATPLTPAARMAVTLNGYGVTFIHLLP